MPDRVAYRDALLAPAAAFTDARLRHGQAQKSPLGQPVAASGAFAVTFTINHSGRRYAVRCFTQHRPQLADRYQAVTEFVRTGKLDFLVPVDYLPGGIRVSDNPWPVVVMPWIDGTCLNDWVDDNLHHTAALDHVRRRISEAVDTLAARGAAHGDLQHGNILVLPDGSIRLIDYDGMYLPTLAKLGAAERGHRNYQHPERSQQYDGTIDSFAAAVIGLSLTALTHEPKLWNDFNHGDNLIFTAADFANPSESAVFDRLERIPSIAEPARRLRDACRVPYEQVPDVLNGRAAAPRTTARPVVQPLWLTGPQVLEATERDVLLSLNGTEVTVVGRITAVKTMTLARGGTFSFVNFGDYRQAAFTVVLWNKVRPSVARNIGDPDSLPGSYISVTGHLTQYHRPGGLAQPQIELQHARAMRVITAADANSLLRGTKVNPLIPQPNTPPSRQQATSTQPSTPTAPRQPPAIPTTPSTKRYADVFSSKNTPTAPVPPLPPFLSPAPPATRPTVPAGPAPTQRSQPAPVRHTTSRPIPSSPNPASKPADEETSWNFVVGAITAIGALLMIIICLSSTLR
ncbi:protein kinase domain-containing protein [Catellatospora chokoriensis]|uniref:Protein kinase domain-containing protein n=1 Tax=Catellatospora chokoriensis TaxID=310353 RepID=A0A8J3JUW3_9ACTN|nr:hypothetical protein Cch02nite_49460 [Catellatospora chokoriensis]